MWRVWNWRTEVNNYFEETEDKKSFFCIGTLFLQLKSFNILSLKLLSWVVPVLIFFNNCLLCFVIFFRSLVVLEFNTKSPCLFTQKCQSLFTFLLQDFCFSLGGNVAYFQTEQDYYISVSLSLSRLHNIHESFFMLDYFNGLFYLIHILLFFHDTKIESQLHVLNKSVSLETNPMKLLLL